ncbi:hypothetical protein GGR56DRAFT_687988 [Xylariaceae sp. FL0804]|nr:hypothetical protein GGR56DRAFT_687988 [Xylariaceae sp. FL0804]
MVYLLEKLAKSLPKVDHRTFMEHPPPGDLLGLRSHLGASVHHGVEVITHIGATLDGIQYNTSRLLFWTAIAVATVIGLFLIHQLAKLRREIETLNVWQQNFYRMWQEDRENDLHFHRPPPRPLYEEDDEFEPID